MGQANTKTFVAIVDDDESVCRALARLLKVSGYQPVTYLSAEAFLQDSTRPVLDCAILDIQLGGMSGIELGNCLNEISPDLPLIFITAHEDIFAMAQQVGSSRAAFLRKTDPGEEVLAAIERAIRRRPVEREAR